jgi:dynein light chain LC8-type
MLEGKAAMGETDMPVVMQHHAMRCASRALDVHDVSDCQSIAAYLKKV